VTLVAVSHVTDVLSVVNPVLQVAEMASANGSLLLLDASHSAAHRPLDVQALGYDFLFLSGHKMLRAKNSSQSGDILLEIRAPMSSTLG
jgi:cysteine desulfurase / selenocysteine lyase